MGGRVARFVDRLEAVDAGAIACGVALLCIITVRSLIELSLEYPTLQLLQRWFESSARGETGAMFGVGADDVAMTALHWPGFYLTVFFGITLAVSAIARQPVGKTSRAVVLLFPIIWLPPILDAVITGGDGYALEYNLDLSFGDLLATFYRPDRLIEGVSPGIRVEILLASIGAAIYVLAKGRGVFRAALAAVATTMVPLIVGSWPGWVPTETLMPSVLGGSHHGRIGAVYLLALVVLGALWAWRAAPVRFRAAVANLRWLRALHYSAMTVIGVLIAAFELDATGPVVPEVIVPAAAAALAMFFSFQLNVQVNDLLDRDIDAVSNPERPLARGTLSQRDLWWLTGLYGMLAIGFAAAASATVVFFTLAYNALGMLYSAPPFRLRKYVPFATLVLAGCSLVAMAAGFSVIAGADALALFPRRAFWMFLIVFMAAFNFKDMKDVEGDRAAGVYTIPVLLGRERGKWVVAALILGAYCAVPPLLGRGGILWIAPAVGVATALLIVRADKPHEPTLFGLYFGYTALVAAVLLSQPDPAAFPPAHLGHYYLMHGDTARARQAFDADGAISDYERNVGLAMVHMYEGDATEAVERARDAMQDSNSAEGASLLYAYTLASTGRVDEAEQVYRDTAREHDSPLAQFNLGTIYFSRGAYADAAASLQSAVAARPDWGEARFNLGNALLKLDRPIEAETQFRRATLTLRAHASLHNNLGLALEHQGKNEEALREFTRALVLNPNLRVAQTNRDRLRGAGMPTQ